MLAPKIFVIPANKYSEITNEKIRKEYLFNWKKTEHIHKHFVIKNKCINNFLVSGRKIEL